MTQVRGECNQITVTDMVLLLRLMRMLDNHAMLQFESGFWTFTGRLGAFSIKSRLGC